MEQANINPAKFILTMRLLLTLTIHQVQTQWEGQLISQKNHSIRIHIDMW